MKLKFTSRPCQEAVKWLAKQPDAQTAWDNCERGDWMWWALRYLPGALPDKVTSVAFARRNARAAKRYAATADYADYAYAADYADYADYAYAADYAARAARAAESATYAATYAAYAACFAESADYAAAYAHAAYAAERKAQADWIRKHVKCPL